MEAVNPAGRIGTWTIRVALDLNRSCASYRFSSGGCGPDHDEASAATRLI